MVRLGRRPPDDGADRQHTYPDGIRAGKLHTAHPHRNRQRRAGENAAAEPGGEVAAGRKRGRPRCGVPGRTCEDAGQAGGGNPGRPREQ